MKSNVRLRESWVWNGSVSDFIKGHIVGYSLNVPCGKSLLGDVRADLDPLLNVPIVNMNNLPYPDNSFDTVIQDPPWKIGFYQRMKPFFECVRVCKVGGRIIYNAYWIPQSDFVELESTVIRQDSQFTNTSIISVFKKIKEIDK